MIDMRETQEQLKRGGFHAEGASAGSQPSSARQTPRAYGQSASIIFFGTDEFSLTTLTALLEADYPVAAVVTKPDSKQGRGHKLTPPPVKVLATSYNIPVWQPEKLRDITADIKALGSPLGVLSSYGKIIPAPTIALFTPGIINIHPSLLPRYRGPSPIETAIMNGDKVTGASIMQLSAGMDDGPVYIAKQYPLKGTETGPQLYRALATLGSELLLESLSAIVSSALTPTPQDDTQATYSQLLAKDDAWLRPNDLTASEAERKIRAHLGFPKTKFRFMAHDTVITKAHTAHQNESPLAIACKDGDYLVVDELIAPSGRRMSGTDFFRGYLRG